MMISTHIKSRVALVGGATVLACAAMFTVGGASSAQVAGQAAAGTPVSGTCTGDLRMPITGDRLVKTSSIPDFPPLSDRTAKVATPGVIPAGQYTLTAGSQDFAHPFNQIQNYEQWYAVFYGMDGSEVGTTMATPDLPDTITFQAWTLGTLMLRADAVALQYIHAPVPVDLTAESIEVACLALTPVPVATTSTSTTTTTVSTPVVPKVVPLAPPEPPAFAVTTTTTTLAPTVALAATAAPEPTTTTTTTPPVVAVVPAQPTAQVLGTVVTRPLALTGGDQAPTVAFGAALLAAGAALVVTARHRRPTRR